MNFSRKGKTLLLFLLVFINIIIRYPPFEHQAGIDSFTISLLANSISTFSYAKWVIHPFSFAGLYPMSTASASPFLISGISQNIGTVTENAVLIVSILLGVFSVFTCFLVAKQIINDDLFAFFVSFVFSLSPNFIRFTYWDATTRNLFMVFFPLFIYAILKINKSTSLKNLGLILIITIVLIVSHRMAFFIPIVFLSFIIALVFSWCLKKIENKVNLTILNVHIFYVLFFIGLLLFSSQFSISFLEKNLPEFYRGYLFQGINTQTIILNITADYFGKIGILLFFGIIGLLYLMNKKHKNFQEFFIIFSTLLFLPLLSIQDYTPQVVLLFYAILIGYGINFILNASIISKKIASIFIFSIIFVSLFFSLYMMDHWNFVQSGMQDSTYNTGIFLKERSIGSSAAASGLLSAQMSSISGKSSLPYGGATSGYDTPEQLIFDSIDKNNVTIKSGSLEDILSSKKLYTYKNIPRSKDEWVDVVQTYSKDKIEKYHVNYAIKIDSLGNGFEYWGRQFSRLFTSLSNEGNVIYVNGRETVYYIPN